MPLHVRQTNKPLGDQADDVHVWKGGGGLGEGAEGIPLRDILGIQPGHEPRLGKDSIS